MRQREIEQHRRKLGEIRNIMSSMKNLALMETRKLARYRVPQQQMVENLTTVAADFLHFHPNLHPVATGGTPCLLVIGSERGFCGDFNEGLIEQALASLGDEGVLLLVGRKLQGTRIDDNRVCMAIEGPGVSEEIPAVLAHLVQVIEGLQSERGPLALDVLYHADESSRLTRHALLPPFADERLPQPAYATTPVLNLPPQAFFAGLMEHYLFAVLHEIFYVSLMAENNRRVQHLEGAVRKLDEKLEQLRRKGLAARQEEITEEIEVILLGAESMRPPRGHE